MFKRTVQSLNLTVPKTVFGQPSAAEIWGIGLLAVTIINSCAAVGIALMPLMGSRTYNQLLTLFIGLGVGSLTGSAIFHLLPEAFQLEHFLSNDAFIWKCWTSVAGVFLFFALDKILKITMHIKKMRKERKTSRGTPIFTLTSSARQTDDVTISKLHSYENEMKMCDQSEKLDRFCAESFSARTNPDENSVKFSISGSMATILPSKDIALEKVDNAKPEIAPVAWMVIFGDALHNFVDGLSIGAAFTKSVLAGVSVCVAVVCEEFPHEFGDVAILVSSGMKARQALFYNLLSAVTCYFGFILGVLVGELSDATVYIFALASGMFLYVALANMVPEMNNAMEKALNEEGLASCLKILFLQCLGVCTGITVMFLLAFYEAHMHFD